MHQSVWEVLGEYGVCSLLLRAIQYLYNRWKSLAGNKLDSFPVCVGLCQSWPLSPIQFIFMDRISRRSKAAEGFNFGDFRNSPLLFADNVVLFASAGGGLQLTLKQFTAECEATGMKISTSKCETMVPSPGQKEVAALNVGVSIFEFCS